MLHYLSAGWIEIFNFFLVMIIIQEKFVVLIVCVCVFPLRINHVHC